MKKRLAIYTGISNNMSFAAGNVGIGLAKHMKVDYDFIVCHTGLSKNNVYTLEQIPHCILRHITFPKNFIEHMLANMPPGRFKSKNALMCFSHFEGFKILNEYEYAIWLDDDVLVRDDISDMLDRFGVFGLANDDPWTVSDQFTDNLVPEPYNGSRRGYRVGIMLLHDTLPYRELYEWLFAKAMEHAFHLKNPEQAVLNLAIQEFSLPVKEIPLSYHADCREGVARTAKVVHFGTQKKVWNTPSICRTWPEWLSNHYVWKELGGEVSKDFELSEDVIPRMAWQPNTIPVAVYMQGGIGDAIIQRRKMEEVLNWDQRIVIDLYTEKKWEKFLHHFYDTKDRRIHSFLFGGEELYHYQKNNYAIALFFSNTVDMEIDFNEELLSNFPLLMNRARLVRKQCKNYGRINDNNMAIHFARCAKDGFGCYTSLNRYDGFHVQNFHTRIPLMKSYEKRYQNLKLPTKYITINSGYTKHGNDVDCKAWPISYYKRFIRIFKQCFPTVGIVQVSGGGFMPLPSCDYHIIGENLELVKYVLRDAVLHLDSEGGMVHLASQLNTRCVVLFGPTPMHYYGYSENLNLQAGDCHDCYWYTHKLWRCYRGMIEPECMYALTPEYVMDQIEKNFFDTLKK